MHRTRSILYWAPRILGVLSILYISVFALDVFQPGVPLLQVLLGLSIHLIPSAILAILLAIGWTHDWLGGVLFLLAGLVLFVLLSNPWWVNALVGGPFFLVGVLFLVSWYYSSRYTP